MKTEDTRRAFKRAKGIAPVVCDGIRGRLWDISRGGLAFSVSESFDTFQIGKIVQINIKLPKTDDAPEGLNFQAPGRVRNVRMEDGRDRQIVAIEFEDIPEEARQILNRMILFFVQELEPIHRLQDIFNIRKFNTNDGMRKNEIARVFNQLVSQYDELPPELKQQVADFARMIQRELGRMNLG